MCVIHQDEQIFILEIDKNSRPTDFGLTLQRVTWKITCNFLQKKKNLVPA